MSVRRSNVLATVAITVGFVVLSVWERKRPLRKPHYQSTPRLARNLAIAGLSAATVTWLERPIVEPLAALVARRRWGLLFAMRLPRPAHTVLAVVLLDYTLYLWHVLVHRVPWLWRFHVVHHVDLDLDASTAVRFHFGEIAASIPWRAAQVLAIGVTPHALMVWQRLLFMSILFHHSNARLPLRFERIVNRLIVTPRMHGIHHSAAPAEINANWSSGLTIWDWLHGTLQLDVPQDRIVIGVPGYLQERDVTLAKSLQIPLAPVRPVPDSSHAR